MNSEQFRVSILACAAFLLPLAAVGCVSSDPADKGTAGASSGGTPSTSGGTSSGGAPTSPDPDAVACPKATVALLTDFTYVDDGKPETKLGASFGDFTKTFSGSTFVYPGEGKTYPLTSDVTMDNWHLSGTIGDYSGFGLSFANCALADASAFKGISFTLSGSVEMGGTLTVNVGTAANDITSAWLNAHKMAGEADKHGFGRCTPPGDNQYDGSCAAGAKTVEVSETPTTVTVLWADLTGGKPSATINPAEITFITWALPAPAGAGTTAPTTYKADIVVDDLKFVE
jgi:hypothetical protein